MHAKKYLVSLVALALAGCGGAGKTPAARPTVVPDKPTTASRGSLLDSAQKIIAMDADGLAAKELEFGEYGTFVSSMAGTPACGVDLYYFKYSTVGAANEPATATGAIMVPTGAHAACAGGRPTVLYAHGNTRRLDANMADMRPDSPLGHESFMQAMLYAAQGYIVVAPNYAGHDTSSLGYHPHHIADQQSKDMIDALTAARAAFPALQASGNGKLFLTGFSEGGYATMATHRAMQAAGVQVTASAPQAGNYAEAASYENLLASASALTGTAQPNFDTLVRFVIKITGWQKAYGNIYSTPSELYPASYAGHMETLFPNVLKLSEVKAKMPAYLLPNDMPGVGSLDSQQKLAFGPPDQSLFKASYMVKLMDDAKTRPCPARSADAPLACGATHPMRLAWFKNDLRNWVPSVPMLMCGGFRDPVVRFENTTLADAYFKAHGVKEGLVTVLDVDSAIVDNDPYASSKQTFQIIEREIIRASGEVVTPENYHGALAYYACGRATRDFFKQH